MNHRTGIRTHLASHAVLDRAYLWLCRQRRRWPDAADVWSFRRDWPAEKAQIRADLRSGRYRFGLQERVTRENGEEIDLWSTRDALVLKALALVLGEHLVRYMDDIPVLAPPRFSLRRAVSDPACAPANKQGHLLPTKAFGKHFKARHTRLFLRSQIGRLNIRHGIPRTNRDRELKSQGRSTLCSKTL